MAFKLEFDLLLEEIIKLVNCFNKILVNFVKDGKIFKKYAGFLILNNLMIFLDHCVERRLLLIVF